MEAGLGPANGGVPGEGEASDLPFVTDTKIVPHPGRGDRPGSKCRVVPGEDEECVNRELSNPESKGRFLATPFNQCQAVAYEILTKCKSPPNYPPEIVKQLRARDKRNDDLAAKYPKWGGRY